MLLFLMVYVLACVLNNHYFSMEQIIQFDLEFLQETLRLVCLEEEVFEGKINKYKTLLKCYLNEGNMFLSCISYLMFYVVLSKDVLFICTWNLRCRLSFAIEIFFSWLIFWKITCNFLLHLKEKTKKNLIYWKGRHGRIICKGNKANFLHIF